MPLPSWAPLVLAEGRGRPQLFIIFPQAPVGLRTPSVQHTLGGLTLSEDAWGEGSAARILATAGGGGGMRFCFSSLFLPQSTRRWVGCCCSRGSRQGPGGLVPGWKTEKKNVFPCKNTLKTLFPGF